MSNFNDRLKLALQLRQMTQNDLCGLTGVPKSAMSQYASGAFEPKRDRAGIIAKALNVSEAWLMGYSDYPMDVSDFDLLELELQKIGVSIGFYEEDAVMWLEFPDGTLEISEFDLLDIQADTLSYLKFKIAELREKRANDFRKKTTSDSTDGGDASNRFSDAPKPNDDDDYEIVPIAARGGGDKPLVLKKKKGKSINDLPDYHGGRR